MTRILLSELLGQRTVIKRRIDSLEAALHDPEAAVSARAERKRLADRLRVIEDRIIAYEPDARTVPGTVDRAAPSATAGHSAADARRQAGNGNPGGGTSLAPESGTGEKAQ
jgi:hypothetical protein